MTEMSEHEDTMRTRNRMTFADVWRPSGTIGRGLYAVIGTFGFAIKHNLDRLVATYVFHRPWGLFNY